MAPRNTKKPEEAAVTAEAVAAEAISEAISEETASVAAAAEPTTVETETAGAEQKAKAQFAHMRELVPVTPAPPRSGEDPNYPIGINGKMWLLPKGKTSMVPRYVAMAFNQAEAAKGTQLDSQAKLLEKQAGNAPDLSKLTKDQVAYLKKLLGL